MKKILSLLTAVILLSFSHLDNTLTEKERKYANDFLRETQQKLESNVSKLSETQLKFRTAPDRWSVEDCIKHIAMTEQGLWHMTDSIINGNANPEKRSEIKATDEQIIQMIADRSKKAQAPESLKPENTPFKSASEALESFKASRQKLIDYVNKTDKDLRNHVAQLPFGSFDTYQMILFIGAHSKRHTLQIEEVMADANFPK